MSRLWVVLLPTLLLTLGIDWLGAQITNSAYTGQFHVHFNSGPQLAHPADHSALTFLGNLVFLQTIAVPVFGTNGPLWSLAFEFWYYVLFPLAVAAIRASPVRWLARAGYLILFLCLLWMLPAPLLLSGLIWLMGVAVWLVSKLEWIKRSADAFFGNGVGLRCLSPRWSESS
jgi:peptidoglycan/LPS O-acetylase OafA/YrhL